jgi:hypothetical protein
MVVGPGGTWTRGGGHRDHLKMGGRVLRRLFEQSRGFVRVFYGVQPPPGHLALKTLVFAAGCAYFTNDVATATLPLQAGSLGRYSRREILPSCAFCPGRVF